MRRPCGIWLIALPAAVAFALGVLVAVGWTPLLHADASADRAVHGAAAGHPAYAAALRALTDALQPTTWRVAGLAAAAWLAWRRRFRPSAYLAAVAVVGSLVSPALKHAAGRPRPHWSDPVLTATGGSWPSGHALAAAAGAASLAIAYRETRQVRRLHPAVLAALLGLAAAAVGATRVLLGVHYPSDVVGGWTLGLLITAGLTRCAGPPPRRAPR